MKKCKSCGRMLKADESGEKFCKNCVDESGKLRSYEEVASNLAKFLRETQGLDAKASVNAAKAIVSSQPVWEKKQGVYFEGDMRKKRNTIISLIVVIVLLVTSVGIGGWVYWGNRPEEQIFFINTQHKKITREIGGVTVHELELPMMQSKPQQIFDDNPNIISFNAPRFNTKGDWIVGNNLYTYDIENDCGSLTNPDSYQYCLSSDIISIGHYSKKGNLYIADVATPSSFRQPYSEKKELSLIALWIDKGTYDPEAIEENKNYRFPKSYNYNQFLEFVSDTNHNQLWVEHRRDSIYDGPYFIGEYFGWTEASSATSGMDSIVLYNPYTKREQVITQNMYENQYLFCDSGIIWMDNRDISLKHPVMYFYDVRDNQEYIISDDENIGFYVSNERYLLVSKGTKKDDLGRPKNGLLAYDLNEKRFLNTPLTETIIEGKLIYRKSLKGVLIGWERHAIQQISKGSSLEETNVAWLEEITDIQDIPWENTQPIDENQLPTLIKIKNLSELESKPIMVAGVNDTSESQNPLLITDKYICWSSQNKKTFEKKLWIGKIADGRDDGIIESICIDISPDTKHNDFSSVSISDQNIYWTKNYPDHSNNICWARLSEIFSDNQVVNLEGQNE